MAAAATRRSSGSARSFEAVQTHLISQEGRQSARGPLEPSAWASRAVAHGDPLDVDIAELALSGRRTLARHAERSVNALRPSAVERSAEVDAQVARAATRWCAGVAAGTSEHFEPTAEDFEQRNVRLTVGLDRRDERVCPMRPRFEGACTLQIAPERARTRGLAATAPLRLSSLRFTRAFAERVYESHSDGPARAPTCRDVPRLDPPLRLTAQRERALPSSAPMASATASRGKAPSLGPAASGTRPGGPPRCAPVDLCSS